MEAEVIGVNNRSVLRIDASRYADAYGFNSAMHCAVFSAD